MFSESGGEHKTEAKKRLAKNRLPSWATNWATVSSDVSSFGLRVPLYAEAASAQDDAGGLNF